MPTRPYRLNSTNLHHFPPPPFSTSTVFHLYCIPPPPYSTVFYHIPPTPLAEFGRIQQNLVEYNRTTLTSTVFHLPISRNQQNIAELSRIRRIWQNIYLPTINFDTTSLAGHWPTPYLNNRSNQEYTIGLTLEHQTQAQLYTYRTDLGVRIKMAFLQRLKETSTCAQ